MDNGASSYRRFLNGDENGLIDIVKEYGANILFFINGFVGNMTISEDLMEDTFCDLIVYKNRYKEKASFKTYLFAIAHNKAMDYIKKNSKYNTVDIEDCQNYLFDENSLESNFARNNDKKQLHLAMSKINTDYRMVLHLLYFENMSYKEVARVLKKNIKQIKNLAYRARGSLKVIMEKEGFVYEEY